MPTPFTEQVTPCCNRSVDWDEAQLVLPCVAGEYDLSIPATAPPAFIEGCQDFLREHNLTEHGVDTSLHLMALYGVMETQGNIARHSPTFLGPVKAANRCQCMGCFVEHGRLTRRQCGLAATALGGKCQPCLKYCKIKLPAQRVGPKGELWSYHHAPLTVLRGQVN